MAFNLGIDVDDTRVVAAVERSGTIRMVALSPGGRSMPPVAHVGGDGEVAVGDEARRRGETEPGGVVPDVLAWLGDGAEHRVNGWAVTGEVLAAHLLAHVVRVAADPEEELGRVTVSHSFGWPPDAVAALRGAAGQAGILDVEVVDRDRAAERAPSSVRHDEVRAAAVGAAALAASRRPAPAATQASAPVAAGAVAAPDPVTGAIAATTVFGDPRLTGADATTYGGYGDDGGGGGGGSGGGGPAGPGGGEGFEPPGRGRLPIYVAGGVLGALLLVLLLVLLLRDDGGGDVATDTSTTTTSTTSSTTTSTSTTTTSTTTTSTTTTVPGTTTTSTTTTIPREIGKAALLESGLVLDYGTSSSETLTFGEDAEEAIAALQDSLGGPDSDTFWRTDSECTGETRRVRWGDLEVVFTRLETDDETLDTFEQWFVGAPGTIPPGLVTLERIGIESTVADLRRSYPNMEISRPIPGSRTGFFTTQPEGNDLIAGFTTDTTDSSEITQMWAGSACQRLADAE